MQTKADKEQTLQKLRLLMPPSPHGPSSGKGMKAPMLGNAEDMDQRSGKNKHFDLVCAFSTLTFLVL